MKMMTGMLVELKRAACSEAVGAMSMLFVYVCGAIEEWAYIERLFRTTYKCYEAI